MGDLGRDVRPRTGPSVGDVAGGGSGDAALF